MSDAVNSPEHYTLGGIETIDYLQAKLGLQGFVAYCQGNAIKYLSRAGYKHDAAEDLRKAEWYCRRAAEALEFARQTESWGETIGSIMTSGATVIDIDGRKA